MIGDIGPGTKLPSLGNIAYDALEAALVEQCRGLIAGGADAILTAAGRAAGNRVRVATLVAAADVLLERSD